MLRARYASARTLSGGTSLLVRPAQPQLPGRTDILDKRFVIVRTCSAGVHVGLIDGLNGKEVTLSDARRIWRWRGANTLHELALRGASDAWTRISEPVPSIVLTEAIEIIPCSADAKANLERSRWAP
jgi:hypothetical protein